ncbi:FAD-dependent oxidoreductase [Lactobacillus sp. ESL0677]|uniref:FAD-dependent oxidoreductase n=1 Tax=Lactobacillus sp. ESL0677 TaxID=2983208 RepID=UPI0023F6620C|nr:FAD-dependent oxidoreductase [Lactobacillus sp. ESL0677]WEV36170.1 FAD-binding protein [Lactobacillus sp. ESL0677]
MKVTENTKWNGDYDVIVLGFGGAGATAARFAADNGAQVLLVEAAPYGHEGGNTRYSAQHVAMAHDRQQISDYYHELAAPFAVDEKTMDVYLDGFVEMPKYFKRYFGLNPFIWSKDFQPGDHLANKKQLCEYPEYQGATTFDFALVHNRDFDAGLWKVIRQKILQRKDQIDIWLNSRATKLLQDPVTDEITGVVIKRQEKQYYIHVKKGVVLATGGFENNDKMQQDYLHITHLTPLGTLYNKGDGIKMAGEVGARMWHMSNYESLGIVPSYVIAEEAGQRGRQISGWQNVKSGSIIAVADDGSRFMREDAKFRHGHIFQHGDYLLPHAYDHAWLVFDEQQYQKFVQEQKAGNLKYQNFFDKLIKANSVAALADKMKLPADTLTTTIARFNQFADSGRDLEFERAPETMSSFDLNDAVYAIKLAPAVLNTQGGPQHDEQARVLNNADQPIKRLYSAGELGGICANRYQGGGNLAECLIFGKIAGENVAQLSDTAEVELTNQVPRINDLVDNESESKIELKANQYLGSSEAGIGGKVLVRVTYQDQTISNVEVLENHETEGIGAVAIKQLPQQIIDQNSTDVDAISGATTTTKALVEAVNQAIGKAKNKGEK